MKSNSYLIFLAIIAAVLFINCSNSGRKETVQDSKEELRKHLAEMDARMKWPVVKAKDKPIDSLDIRIEDLSIPELEQSFDIVKDSVFILSEDEFSIARDLVKKHFEGVVTSISDDSIDDSYKPFPYNYYFKQYIGYKDNERKKKLVYVNMFTGWHTPNGWARELKHDWVKITDGGKWDGHVIVDIENKKVINFAII